MNITLYVTLCLNLAQPGSCVDEMITDSSQHDMTMQECLGVDGMKSAEDFWEKHPLYRTWRIKGWKCQIGNRKPPDKGGA